VKTLGMIGGLSWESTVEYYRKLNQQVSQRLGDWHTPPLLLDSVEFYPMFQWEQTQQWDKIQARLIQSGKRLEQMGAQAILICCNTMHKVADPVQNALKIPLLNIIDATATVIKHKQLSKIGLLGTKATMEDGFYQHRMKNTHNIQIITPPEKERTQIDTIIFKELILGKIKKESREFFCNTIENLQDQQTQGVILGCTELPMLLSPNEFQIPLFNSMELHINVAVNFILS
jgi:aspartate racemase